MAINSVVMITDRNLSDVEIAKSLLKKGLQRMSEDELQVFLNGLKGAYNYTDFNRVEGAVKYIAENLVLTAQELKDFADELGVAWLEKIFGVPYSPSDYEEIQTKTDWNVYDIVSGQDRERYIGNILLVLRSLGIDLGEISDNMNNFDYKTANRIESSLELLDGSLSELVKEKKRLISGTKKAWVYSGDVYGGEI